MTRRILAGTACCRARLLAACSRNNGSDFQGWIEADFIFVSPDEQGRVEELKVREGDRVENRRAAVHARCRPASGRTWRWREATLTNAKQAFERAQQLAQDRFRHAEGF